MAISRTHSSTPPVLDLAPRRGLAWLGSAFKDLGAGLALWRLGLALGWLDIKMRYRGSMLGPFWLTISTAVMTAAMGTLYAMLYHMELHNFLPFLSLSLVLWGFVSGVANESPLVFTQAANLIQAQRMPFTIHVMRLVVRNVLVLLHNIVVIVVVFAICGARPQHSWTLLPVSALWLVDAAALTFLFGTLGARFRDIAPVVGSLMQIFFFISPIIWLPSMVHLGPGFLLLNPIYPIFEIMRAPLLGTPIDPSLYLAALCDSAVLIALSLALFCRMRARIAYWI